MGEQHFAPRRLRVLDSSRRTDTITLFRFVADDGFSLSDLSFEPGQVAEVTVPDIGRAYLAIASAPDDPTILEFLVKRVGDVGEQLCDLGARAVVDLTGFLGKGFPVDQFEGKDLVFVSVGTAIAPIRAALSHVAQKRSLFGRVVLVHGVRRPEDFSVDEEIDSWRQKNIHVVLTVTQPPDGGWRGETGRVQSLLANAVRDSLDPVAFICGSDEMMAETADALVSLGLSRDRILRNY